MYQLNLNANIVRLFVFENSNAYDSNDDGEQIVEVNNNGDACLGDSTAPSIGMLSPSMILANEQMRLELGKFELESVRQVSYRGVRLNVMRPSREFDGIDLKRSSLRRLKNGKISSFSKLVINKSMKINAPTFRLTGLNEFYVFCMREFRVELTQMCKGFEFKDIISLD